MQLTPDIPGEEVASAPTVSVIITYYNQERFIRETVLSVTQQTYPHLEIIVVDDGSTTPAERILSDIPGISIFRISNGGCPAARNYGFSQSTGNYLVFLDGDDLLLPDAVVSQLRILQRSPDAALAFGAAQFIDVNGDRIPSPALCRARQDYFLMMLECNPIACPGAALIRRDSFIAAGMFDERFYVVEDYDLYLRLLRTESAVRHPRLVVLYRRHSGNLSKDSHRMLRFVYEALTKVESSGTLTARERRHLKHGRRRWAHGYLPQQTLRYRIADLYFRCCAMSTVPLSSYFRSKDRRSIGPR